MMLALTRGVSPALARCELTHVPRQAIDLALARKQHGAYERALERLGCEVRRLPAEDTLPDCVFIEDTAVVVDELAIIARSGAVSRRAETGAVAPVLGRYRELCWMAAPGTMDGGDVLVAGRTVFVGQSTRTNASALAQMAGWLEPLGYDVRPVPVVRCLHLKSAVTLAAAGTLLVNPAWVDVAALGGFDLIEVDAREPWAANALRVGSALLVAAGAPRTEALLRARGLPLLAVELSELAKAEGAVTCGSLVFRVQSARSDSARSDS